MTDRQVTFTPPKSQHRSRTEPVFYRWYFALPRPAVSHFVSKGKADIRTVRRIDKYAERRRQALWFVLTEWLFATKIEPDFGLFLRFSTAW